MRTLLSAVIYREELTTGWDIEGRGKIFISGGGDRGDKNFSKAPGGAGYNLLNGAQQWCAPNEGDWGLATELLGAAGGAVGGVEPKVDWLFYAGGDLDRHFDFAAFAGGGVAGV